MYKGTNPRLKAHLVAAGVKVLDVPWANNLADVRKVTRMLGKALGAEARAKAMLKEMDAKLAAARAAAPHPPVSALIYEPNGYTASDAVTDAMMRAGGLSNAAKSMPMNRLGRVSLESVLAAAPQLVILNAAREGGPALADAAIRNPGAGRAQGSLADRRGVAHAAALSRALVGRCGRRFRPIWPKKPPALRSRSPRIKTWAASVPREWSRGKGNAVRPSP